MPEAAPRQGLFGRQLIEQSKRMFRSPVFIIMALLNTVFMVTMIASIFLQNMSFSQVITILANFDLPSELMSYANRILSLMSKLGSGMIVVDLVSHLPELLLCVGFWILIVTADKSDEPMSGLGFLCAKIYIVIKMAVMCIGLLICLVLSVVFAVSSWVSVSVSAKIFSSIFLAAMIVFTMVIVMYFFCLLHTVKVCRLNAVQGERFSAVSVYAAVLTILAALTSILGLLSAIVNYETAGIICFGCKIAWMVLISLWIILYKNKINEGSEEE